MHVAFVLWAAFAMTWLANSVRTRGVDGTLLRSSPAVAVHDGGETLAFIPAATEHHTGLVFFCGSGIAAAAYAPMLRPLADAGVPVFIVRLPWRFAPLDVHKEQALDRALAVIAAHDGVARWVVAGHSLGGALSARLAARRGTPLAALVLVGTTHPKRDDLSSLGIPVTKIYGTHDGVAPVERVLANRDLLPAHTRWVVVEGGNHSQFGHYGRQLLDRAPAIARAAQQAAVTYELFEVLHGGTEDTRD